MTSVLLEVMNGKLAIWVEARAIVVSRVPHRFPKRPNRPLIHGISIIYVWDCFGRFIGQDMTKKSLVVPKISSALAKTQRMECCLVFVVYYQITVLALRILITHE